MRNSILRVLVPRHFSVSVQPQPDDKSRVTFEVGKSDVTFQCVLGPVAKNAMHPIASVAIIIRCVLEHIPSAPEQSNRVPVLSTQLATQRARLPYSTDSESVEHHL